MEAHRKTLVELASSILFLVALFIPSFGLVTVEEINAGVGVLIVVATLGTPIVVAMFPNVANWQLGRGPKLMAYRSAIVSTIGSGLSLAALYWPSVGIVTGAHVDAFVAVVLTLIALVGPPLVWRIPNGRIVQAG